jgi:hypothetical protein
MKKFLYILALSLPFIACTHEPPPTEAPPADIIPVEKMVSIMADIQMAEASIGLMPLSHSKAVARYATEEANIFKKYRVDSLRYQKSYSYYITQRNTIKKLYQMVMDTLLMRKMLYQEKVLQDSLAKATQTTNNK